MASADLELQEAIYSRLVADPALSALVGSRIYDKPEDDATYPYVTIGEADAQRDDATCVNGQRIYLTLHAWSTYSGGFKEVKPIAAAVVDALHLDPLALTTFRLSSIVHRTTRTFRDPDWITSHAAIEFVARVYR